MPVKDMTLSARETTGGLQAAIEPFICSLRPAAMADCVEAMHRSGRAETYRIGSLVVPRRRCALGVRTLRRRGLI